MDLGDSKSQSLSLASSVVAVPCGWTLHIKVDLKIETYNDEREINNPENWNETTMFNYDEASNNKTAPFTTVDGHKVLEVNIKWSQPDGSCPVEDVRVSSDSPDNIVYTIGDAMSFTEFIMTLRSILAHHGGNHDILDHHDFLNLSSTRQHPLLAKTHAEEPARWLHVKLVEGKEITSSWATLLMRGDDLYVHGFKNQYGTYGLNNERGGHCLLRIKYKPLGLDVSYGSLLRNTDDDDASREVVVTKLSNPGLGRDFATDAVRVLSSYIGGVVVKGDEDNDKRRRDAVKADNDKRRRDAVKADNDKRRRDAVKADNDKRRRAVGKALAGLIFMICESARTNPIHDYVARGWNNGWAFDKHLMDKYVWRRPGEQGFWGHGSQMLRDWEDSGNYTKPDRHTLRLLRDIYLVRNGGLSSKAANPTVYSNKNNKMDLRMLGAKPNNRPSKPSTGETKKRPISNNDEASGNQEPMPKNSRSSDGGRRRCIAIQPEEDGRRSSRQEDNNSLPKKQPVVGDSERRPNPDAAKGRGRPRVELSAIHFTKPPTYGMEIIIFDGKRGQIVFNKKGRQQGDHEEQSHGKQGMSKLMLTRPYTGISAEYGCSTIRIDVPNTDPLGLECDVGADMCLSTVNNSKQLQLRLARNVVAVPCGKVLHIEVDLPIKTSKGNFKRLERILEFKDRKPIGIHEDDEGDKVEMNITRYPEAAEMYTAGPKQTIVRIGKRAHRLLKIIAAAIRELDLTKSSPTKFDPTYQFIPTKVKITEEIIGEHKLAARMYQQIQAKVVKDPMIDLVHDGSEPPEAGVALAERTKANNCILSYCSGSKPAAGETKKSTTGDSKDSGTQEQPRKTQRGNDGDRRSLASQPGEDSGRSSGQEDNNSPPEKPVGDSEKHPSHDATKGRGRPRVELLAMHFTEAPTNITEIIVFDGKRGHIVFNKMGQQQEDQEEQSHEEQIQLIRSHGESNLRLLGATRTMFKLVLTGPNRGISVEYGCFTIRIDTPNADPVRFEWDCDNSDDADEVDAPKPKPRWIKDKDDRKIAQVTYAVMSNALEATVDVILDLKDGHSLCGQDGKIAAHIDGFGVRSDLFHQTCVTGQCLSTVNNLKHLQLQLARNVVAVPCGKVLHIEVDLPIKTSKGNFKRLERILEFKDRKSTDIHEDDEGDKVKVNITWYPEAAEMATARPKQPIVRFDKRAYHLLMITTTAIRELDQTNSSPKKIGRTYQCILENVKIIERIVDHKLAGTIYQLIQQKVKVIEETGDPKLAAWMYQQIHHAQFEMSTTPSRQPKQTSSEEECITSALADTSHLAETEMSTAGPSHPTEQTGNEISEEESIITTAETSHSEEVPVVYPVGDELSFISFMMNLRRTLADHKDGEDILDRHHDSNISSTREHPLLAKNRHDQPARWLHIKLEVAGEEATLLVRDDNMYCFGFMNQNGDCYELSNPEGWKLPSEYNAVPLDWGGILDSARLGRTFAADAVRVLSRFAGAPAEADGDDDARARLALVGLIVMVCEAARMNPLRDAIARGWNTGTEFTEQLMEYIGHWELISVALLDWKDGNYGKWTMDPRLAEITGINSPIDALKVIHLVRNFSVEERQLLHYAIYGSPTDEE
ncbi:unnamed protein product [Urochloa decumbens]|uniref:DUF6598 domain-containing protein n=1 Tax=Urochloa decumbens TaxID=240449 RepID=A0ABC9B7W1_9POAL